MMADPHSLIEGIIIASFAVRCHHAFIYLRGELVHAGRRLQAAIDEAYAAGYLGDNILEQRLRPQAHPAPRCRRLHLRRGDGAARLARGLPRPAPAAPAVPGHARALPVADGGQQRRDDRHRAVHRPQGRRVVPVDGHARSRPARRCTHQRPRRTVPASTRCRWAPRCARCSTWPAGCATAHQLKAWTPGGSTTPLLTAEHLDTPLDFEGVVGRRIAARHHGASWSWTRRSAWCKTCLRLTQFYAHESCGKCTPCREGTYWMTQILARLEQGIGSAEDLDTLLDTCDNIFGRSFCALGDGATSPIVSGHPVLPRRVRRPLRAGRLPVRRPAVDPCRSALTP